MWCWRNILNIFNVSHQDAKKGGGVAAIIRGASLIQGGHRLGPGLLNFGHHFVNIVLGPAALLLPAAHVALPLLQHPHHDGAHLRLQGPDVFSR